MSGVCCESVVSVVSVVNVVSVRSSMRSRLPTGCLVKKWNRWFCQWKFKGVPYTHSLDTTSKEEAALRMKTFMASVVSDISNGDFLLKYGDAAKKTAPLISQQITPVSIPQAPLDVHLQSYFADLITCGRDQEYIYIAKCRITRLIKECGWKEIKDITADSFIHWRSSKTRKAPKTLNHYLAAILAFLSWMLKFERIEKNPLSMVGKVEERGREVRVRRAFTGDEMKRLLSVVTPMRKAIYLMAVYTGLRRGELKALTWGDIMLDSDPPRVLAQASTTKNHKDAMIGLHPDIVDALKIIRPKVDDEVDEMGSVFPELPSMEQFKEDLKLAGIPFLDPKGRRGDFHSLRYTLGTMLAVAGIQPRVAMEVMRHSDMRLTQKIYTDSNLLPTFGAVCSLPSLMNVSKPVPKPLSSAVPSMPDDELKRTCQALLKELERREGRK